MISPEQTLWLSALNLRVSDAIYPFKIPDACGPETSIDEQYDALRRMEELPAIVGEKAFNKRRAIMFLESDQLDQIAHNCGYDDRYVDGVAALVQKCLTLAKKLYG